MSERLSQPFHKPYISRETQQKVVENDEKDLLRAGSPLLGITKTETGKYRVSYPGLQELKTGHYLGTSEFETDSYAEATEFFKRQSEASENISTKPILDLAVDGAKITFSSLDNFHPRSAIEKTRVKPNSIISELVRSDDLDTYSRTSEIKGWKDQLFSLVENFISSDAQMQQLLETHHIKDLHNLSPKQAIDLTTQIVILLTKYYDDGMEQKEKTADNSSVMQLLTDGIQNRNNPEWKGNGVCRNFASITKAIFQALKSNQNIYSQLNNTYCANRVGLAPDYNPGAANQTHDYGPNDFAGHAWNNFIQVSHDGTAANFVSVDVTWANYDLDHQTALNLDHTLSRMRRPVSQIAAQLPDNEQARGEITKILSYYDLLIRNPQETATARAVYARSVLEMLKREDISLIAQANASLLDAVVWVFTSGQIDTIDSSELETLFSFAPNNEQYVKNLVEMFLTKNKSRILFDHRSSQLIFRDPRLQSAINAKLLEIGKYADIVENNRRFREHLALT